MLAGIEVCFTSVMCDIPPAPDNGDIDISGSGVGAVVTYTCDTCFKLCDGDRTRTCLPNGQWSGTPPTCSRKSQFIMSHNMRKYTL